MLALIGNLRPSCPDSLDGDILQLRDADPGGTDGLQHQRQAAVPLLQSGVDQPQIFLPAQLPFLSTENFALLAQRL